MISSWSTCHKILHILMFITSFGEQNITYKCCSNFLIHLCLQVLFKFPDPPLFTYGTFCRTCFTFRVIFLRHIRLRNDCIRIAAVEPETPDAEKISAVSSRTLFSEPLEYHHNYWLAACHAGISLCESFYQYSCRCTKL